MAIPTENELMDAVAGDELDRSYRYFLNRAKEASARADELARQLIEQGIRKDLRREAAQEELAGLCGSYAAADEIELDAYGNIDKPEEGTPLRTCLDESKHSIVYLTTMPPDQYATEPHWVKEKVLGCNVQGATNPLCDRTDFSDVAALGLATWIDPEAKPVENCMEASSAIESLSTGFKGHALANFVAQPWFSVSSLALLGRMVRVEVDLQGRWRLVSGGIPIMSSDAQDGLFPGCLSNGNCRSESAEQIMDFSRSFRDPGSVGGANPRWTR